MSSMSISRRRFVLGGLAAAGIVVAHGLAYAFTDRDPHARLEHLRATGHENWPVVVVVAFAFLVGGLALHLTGLLKDPDDRAVRSVGGVFLRLTMLQTIGFLALEFSERLVSAGVAELIHDPAVGAGLLLQIAFAALAALLLVALTTTIVAVIRKSRTRNDPRGSLQVFAFPSNERPRLEVATGAGCVRGPPVPAL